MWIDLILRFLPTTQARLRLRAVRLRAMARRNWDAGNRKRGNRRFLKAVDLDYAADRMEDRQ